MMRSALARRSVLLTGLLATRTMSLSVPQGVALLRNSRLNQGLCLSLENRAKFHVAGLLPAAHESMDTQLLRVRRTLQSKSNDLERYIFLMTLMDISERLFYRALDSDLDGLMPIVYTPTVGKACQEYSNLHHAARGLHVTIKDLGNVAQVIANWPFDDVRAVVVTDGERILGLGDLGANGMGIPVGKSCLYSACAGIDPRLLMPVTIDVGTDNKALLEEPLYIGLRQKRERGEKYDQLIDEFITATRARFGEETLIQFEDFGSSNAFRLLEKYENKICCFNDDIQGTAAVSVAGILTSAHVTNIPLSSHTFLFLGAGMAATGIAELLVCAMVKSGVNEAEARKKMFFVDSAGLLVKGRKEHGEMPSHKKPFVQDRPWVSSLLEAIEVVKPTVLVGVSAQGGAFDEAVLRKMAAINQRPIIFALSNPTDKAECTAQQAYMWTEGRGLFGSGSPFATVALPDGRTFVPGQCNNSYIFPGLSLGVIFARAKRIPRDFFLLAAETLSAQVDEASLSRGTLMPPLARSREVAVAIALAIAEQVFARGLTDLQRPDDLENQIRRFQYDPHVYEPLTPRL